MNPTQKQHSLHSASICSGFWTKLFGQISSVSLLIAIGLTQLEAAPRTPIADGHWDLGVDFNWVDEAQPELGGEWEFFLYTPPNQERTPLDDIYFVVDDRYLSTIPSEDNWPQVLGPAGGPRWTLPETARPDEIFLGFRVFEQPSGSFEGLSAADQNARVRVELIEVSGSGRDAGGDYVMYQLGLGSFPNPDTIFFSTRPENEPLELPILSNSQTHAHYAWAMTAKGRYEVVLRISGRIRATGEIVTGEGRVVFQVNEGVGPPTEFAAIDASNFPWVWHPELGWLYWLSEQSNEGWLIDLDNRPYFWLQSGDHTLLTNPLKGNWRMLR